MPAITITAGGTGGHMFPAEAFAAQMVSRNWRVSLVTDARGQRYAQDFPASTIVQVPSGRIGLGRPFSSVIGSVQIVRATLRSTSHIKEHGPDLVAGFGGYASFPCLLAARMAKVPIMIHEQNAVLGRVNRFFSRSAWTVASGYDRLERLPPRIRTRHVSVGNPVRPEVARVLGQSVYPPVSDNISIVVTGGSQGASSLGEIVPAAICALPEALRSRIEVIQQTRAEQISDVRARYKQAGVCARLAGFFPDIAEYLGRAHLVIARSGASTLAELALAGRPAILIPLPWASDDHQTANARTMVEAGAADLFEQTGGYGADHLSALIAGRLSDIQNLTVRSGAARGCARPYAARSLADLAESLGRD